MKYKKIFVTGHRGMVGSAICRRFESFEDSNVEILTRSRAELDLTNSQEVDEFLKQEKPDCVINAAAKVGGIHANNTYPADFAVDNLAINLNLVRSSYEAGVERFLNLGSSCIYPKMAPQPIPEEALLTGPLEVTNEAYALAKIAGLKLCQYYRQQFGVVYHSAMPCNLYGPGDNYHAENSHVLPALIRKFHEAKEENREEVVMWGTGSPLREFLHVDDLSMAVKHLIHLEDPEPWINVGSGAEVTILELAQLVKKVVGFEGEITNDLSKPDGTPRKLMDNTKIESSGWKAEIDLERGIRSSYEDFLTRMEAGTLRL